MSSSNQSMYLGNNPVLDAIYSDFTKEEIRAYDLYEGDLLSHNFSGFKEIKENEELDQPFPYAQIDETAETISNQFEALKRSAMGIQYNNQHVTNHMQQMASYDRNRNSKLYNNFSSNYAKEFNENVASPTISSSCEPEKVSGSLQAGLSVNENLVHSTTNSCQGQSATSHIDEARAIKAEPNVKEEILSEFQSIKTSSNENSSILGATKLEEALPAELSRLGRSDDRGGGPVKVRASEKNLESSCSSSPGLKHAAKRPRTMNSYSDIIDGVREAYAYLEGCSMYDKNSYIPNPAVDHSFAAPIVPYRFSMDQYPGNNISQPVDRQKLSFNFANTADYRFGTNNMTSNYHSNQTGYNMYANGPMNPTYPTNCLQTPGGYAYCSQQPHYPSTPSKEKPHTDFNQVQRTLSTSLNATEIAAPDTRSNQLDISERLGYIDDAKYTMSPCKTPLTYHNLDDPSESNMQKQASNNPHAKHWISHGGYQGNANIRPAHSGRPDSDDPTNLLHNLQRTMQNKDIMEHPLYILLRDLIIVDANFDKAVEPFSFPNNLPEQFEELVRNFYMRSKFSPPFKKINSSVNDMVTEATKKAHATIIEKMKKRKMKGGFLVQVSKQPGPDINNLCDAMSKSNELGPGGNHAQHWHGIISPPQTAGNHHMVSAPPTSPVGMESSTYYPPNATYSAYQDQNIHSMTPSQNNDFHQHHSLTPSSKSRSIPASNCYHPMTHNYNNQYATMAQPPYNSNNFLSTYPTNSYSDPYMPFQHYSPARPQMETYGHFKSRDNFDSRVMAPPDPMTYGVNCGPTNPNATNPHLMYLMEGERGIHSLPSSPRRMGRGNQSMNLERQEIEVEKKGKNKVLPKEAVNIMEEWLRKHEDNPYPSDEEKESFLNQTKLSINQINYWFTNARRRKLPKWQSERQQVQEKPRNAPQSSRAEEE